MATVVTLRKLRRGVFFVRIIPAKHSSIIDQIPIFLPLGVQFFIGLWFFLADPRPPNFAEIHARGRRGRLEYDHRDLIPPWGHRLLHGEAEKPTMLVWLDRNEVALPSRQTGMVGSDNDGHAGHGRHKANSMWSILRHTRDI